MAELLIQVKNDVFEYIKSLDDYSVFAEEDNCLVIERNELSGIKIIVIDSGEELLFSVNLCPIDAVSGKLEKLLSMNMELLPVAFGLDGETITLITSVFTENLDENELVGALISVCNGVETFAEEILDNKIQ